MGGGGASRTSLSKSVCGDFRHKSELFFIKNGQLSGQKHSVSMGGGIYFAVGRYYGSFRIRCQHVHQLGGDEKMDFSAFDRLCG